MYGVLVNFNAFNFVYSGIFCLILIKRDKNTFDCLKMTGMKTNKASFYSLIARKVLLVMQKVFLFLQI